MRSLLRGLHCFAFLRLAAVLLLGVALLSVAQQATSTSAKDKQFKIITVTLTKVWPLPPNNHFKANEGYIFVEVSFVPVPLETTDDYPDDRDAFLVDSLGNKSGSVFSGLVGEKQINGHSVPEYGQFVFPMKVGAKPQEMLVNGLSIDLTKALARLQTRAPAKSTKK